MGSDYGNPIVLIYESIGKGKEEISTYDRLKLKKSVKEAAKRLGIPMDDINEVTYNYNALNLESTASDNNIPNGGVLTIKLKSRFR